MDRSRANQLIRNVSRVLFGELCELLEEEIEDQKRIRKRRRAESWSSACMIKEPAEDPGEFRSSLQMSQEGFQTLLELITPEIKKTDTLMRDALPAKLKLEITLSYLATGNSYGSLQQIFHVSKAAISLFIPIVCDAIYHALADHIKLPTTEEMWNELETGFREKWHFPKCYGVIDGKYFAIRVPAKSGSVNYRRMDSMILMALVDHDYCFRYIDVGANGSVDKTVFNNCSLLKVLEHNFLPAGGVIVGDSTFSLKPYLMVPYSHKKMTPEEKVFNYRLSRPRRIVENAIGVLVSRFQIFQRPMTCTGETADKIIRSACAIHNWLIFQSMSAYIPAGYVDEENIDGCNIIPGAWRSITAGLASVGNLGSNNYSREARDIRDAFREYFLNEGQVSWQDKMVN